jgi:hypothetical protein
MVLILLNNCLFVFNMLQDIEDKVSNKTTYKCANGLKQARQRVEWTNTLIQTKPSYKHFAEECSICKDGNAKI